MKTRTALRFEMKGENERRWRKNTETLCFGCQGGTFDNTIQHLCLSYRHDILYRWPASNPDSLLCNNACERVSFQKPQKWGGSGNYRSPAVVSQPRQKTGAKNLWSRGWGLPYIMRQVTGIIVGPKPMRGLGLRLGQLILWWNTIFLWSTIVNCTSLKPLKANIGDK